MEWRGRQFESLDELRFLFLVFVYGHEGEPPRPEMAAGILASNPGLTDGDDFLACTTGNLDALWQAIITDADWVNRNEEKWRCPDCKGLLSRPPLIAVTQSSLARLPEFRERMVACTKLLLEAGADPDKPWKEAADGHPLSALYGAVGVAYSAEMTKLLLAAGANPNDGESLYHSTECPDIECTRLLLEAGAKVEGSNALHHCLDSDDIDRLRLLLAHRWNANDPSSGIGPPLLWAIRRGRSAEHISALLEAGADPAAKNADGVSAYRLAVTNGLPEVAATLRAAGAGEDLAVEEEFVAACARCDEREARRILAEHPKIFTQLSAAQLRQLPQMIESEKEDAARLMVEVGWPIGAKGGDWDASALNHAVYRGNAVLARFLLEHGASWEERHAHGDNVRGALGWSSRNIEAHPAIGFPGDWVGCAQVLLDHGMPLPDAGFEASDEVMRFFEARRKANGPLMNTDKRG